MKILKKLKEIFRVQFCHAKYKILLKKLRKEIKKRKLRVLFYVTENQKWGYQSLYELFEQSEKFEPIVVVGILTSVHKGKDNTRNNLEENYQFFKTRNMNVKYGYKNGDYIDLKTFKPDIIFYEQSWELPKIHQPSRTSCFALNCYASYSIELFEDKKGYIHFNQSIWKFFVDSKQNLKRYINYNKSAKKNCVIVGFPKLDIYLKNENINTKKIWKETHKFKIVYAPHHSFEENSLNLATFQKNGQFILNLAKSHPETTWIFKPHPRFKFALLKNNIMTESEIENYYKEWESIGKVYTQGDYINLFKSSDLLITDCGSFLAEYLPTKNPIIRLIKYNSQPLNELGKIINKCCYCIDENDLLEKVFINLTKTKKDNKKNERLLTLNNFLISDTPCANKIFNYLKNIMEENNV